MGMKQIKNYSILLLLFLILSAAANAQRRVYAYADRDRAMTRFERLRLQRDVLHLRVTNRIATRDGIISPEERVRIHRAKAKTRRDAYRFRHNNRRRLI